MNRTIVMSRQFADEAAKLDGTVKQKVITFMTKFQLGVDGGLDLKPPKAALSKGVWTARVNDNYRAVLADVGQGAWALISVRTHDEAYDFATRFRLELNPVTGGYDIIDERALEKARALASSTVRVAGPATGGGPSQPSEGAGGDDGVPALVPASGAEPGMVVLDADVLVSVGLDPETAHSLAGSVDRTRAEEVAENLPIAQGAALLDVLAGRAIEDIRDDYVAPEPVDVGDVQAALRRPVSQMTFVDMKDAQEVQAAMSGSLEAWRVWLHPAQRVLVDHGPWNGPFRVTGGAGTGKTVTAVHRAVHLARQPDLARVPGARLAPVLFVTFTRNLATAIRSQVATIVEAGGTDDEARRERERVSANIEVLNLDVLARRIASNEPSLVELVGKGRVLSDRELEDLCATSAAGTAVEPEFLQAEWEQVVLANGITTQDDYLRVPRSGRGHRLSRAQRVEVWKCVERLTRELDVTRTYTFEQLRDLVARALTADRANRAEDGSLASRMGVRHLVVDEAQDLTPAHWRMLRSLVPSGPDDMFIAGDAHQRIYGRPVPLSRYGIETRGRSRRLTVNYRTSRQILRWSLGVADENADDLDEGIDPLTGERSIFDGPAVQVAGQGGLPADPDVAMVRWLHSVLAEEGADGGSIGPRDIAVVRSSARAVADTRNLLEDSGIPAVEVGRDTDEDRLDDAVRVMTMHRAKGLEYRAVVIRDGAEVPSDEEGMVDLDKRRQRNLYYVAATRARERLLVC